MVFMQGSFTKLLFTALIFTATISFVTFSAPVDPFSYGASGQPHLHPPFPQGLARFTQIQQQLWITRLSWKPHILKQKKEGGEKKQRKKKTKFVKSQNWMYTKKQTVLQDSQPSLASWPSFVHFHPPSRSTSSWRSLQTTPTCAFSGKGIAVSPRARTPSQGSGTATESCPSKNRST